MSRLTKNDINQLMEAYNAVYDLDLREELEEEREVQELALEIIENAAYVLFSQGYDVNDLIDYFAEADEEVIAEDFANFAEGNILIESVAVSDEYIAEQFKILNEGILDAGLKLGARALGSLRGGVGRVLSAGANQIQKGGGGIRAAAGAMGRAATRAASQTGSKLLSQGVNAAKGLVGKVGGTLSKIPGARLLGRIGGRALPVAGAALYGMDAANRFKKGDWGGGLLSGLGAATSFAGPVAALAPAAIQMGTDALGLTGDKSRKSSPTSTKPPSTPSGAPKPPKGAGNVNVPGRGQRYYASSDKKYYKNYNDALAARNSRRGVKPSPTTTPPPGAPPSQTPPGASGAPGAPSRPPGAPSRPSGAPSKPPGAPAPSKPATGVLGNTTFERRTPTSAEQQGAQDYRAKNPNASPEDVLKAAQAAGKPATPDYGKMASQSPSVPNSVAFGPNAPDLIKTTNTLAASPTTGTTPINPAGTPPTPTESTSKKKPVTASSTNESYEPYDIVLEYLFSQGHVDTLDEALYVMMQMDSENIRGICEAAADQSDKQIEKGIKTTYKGQNVLDNLHQGRSPGLNRLPANQRSGKEQRMRDRLKSRRDDLFGERNRREGDRRTQLMKLLGL